MAIRQPVSRIARAIIAAAVGASCVAAAAAQSHSRRVWSLERLGVSRVVLTPHGRPTRLRPFTIARSRPIAFELPVGAHQGGNEWFVMRLHFKLELARSSGSGLVDVSASTDGTWSSDFVEIHVRRRAKAIRLTWSKVGLIAGAVSGDVIGRKLDLSDANIMVIYGIRPGRNTMQFEVRSSGKARVQRVLIYPDSGVYLSRHGPGTLRLQVSASPAAELHVGQTLHVRMNLFDPRVRPVREVNVAISYNKKYFRLLNPPAQVHVRVVARGRPYRRTFDLRALAVGRPAVEVLTQSVNASPAVTVRRKVVAAGAP